MDNTKIEWTDATWNPIRGCSPVSEGCRNCYAARMAHRFSQNLADPYFGLVDRRGGRAVFNGNIKVVPSAMEQPLRWRRPRRIFVNSMSDLFHENVNDGIIHAVFSIMARARHHTFQVLTKRPERMLELLTLWKNIGLTLREGYGACLPNVWLGVSVENQKAADERIPLLLQCPAAVRFLSCEPLLGPVNLRVHESLMALRARGKAVAVDWVIAGGESGPGSRPMHPAWVRSLRDQCAESGVPFLFKQWGDHPDVSAFDSVPMVNASMQAKHCGRMLDGRTHDEFPEVTP